MTLTALQDMPVLLAHEDLDWQQHGICSGNQELNRLFFDHTCTNECSQKDGHVCNEYESVIRSREICNQCPAEIHCRWWAVVTNLYAGVAGGLTQAQRLRIRKELRKDPAGKLIIEKGITSHVRYEREQRYQVYRDSESAD